MTQTKTTATKTKWTTDPAHKRIKWREQQGGSPRAYGDFRDFADVGGKQESLKTTDPEVAELLVSRRLTELQDLRSKKQVGGRSVTLLGEYAARHLREKAEHEDVTDKSLAYNEKCLRRAIEFFGATQDLAAIKVKDVNLWVAWLREKIPTLRGRSTPSGSSLNGHLYLLCGPPPDA